MLFTRMFATNVKRLPALALLSAQSLSSSILTPALWKVGGWVGVA